MAVNILSRSQSSSLTQTQAQINENMAGLSHQFLDVYSIAGMMAGGLAYRVSKMAVFSLAAPLKVPLLTRIAAPFLSLASEVSAFRETSQLLRPVSTSESWLTTFTQFAALKFFGHFALGQNLVFTHTLQSTGMLAAHQITFSLGLTTRPQGDLFSQLIHAELYNLQMSAGMALGHLITGGRFLEREAAWEVQTKALQKNLPPSFLTPSLKSAFALAGGTNSFFSPVQASKDSQVMRMAKDKREKPGKGLVSTTRSFDIPALLRKVKTDPFAISTLAYIAKKRPELADEAFAALSKTAKLNEEAAWALYEIAAHCPHLAPRAIESLMKASRFKVEIAISLGILAFTHPDAFTHRQLLALFRKPK